MRTPVLRDVGHDFQPGRDYTAQAIAIDELGNHIVLVALLKMLDKAGQGGVLYIGPARQCTLQSGSRLALFGGPKESYGRELFDGKQIFGIPRRNSAIDGGHAATRNCIAHHILTVQLFRGLLLEHTGELGIVGAGTRTVGAARRIPGAQTSAAGTDVLERSMTALALQRGCAVEMIAFGATIRIGHYTTLLFIETDKTLKQGLESSGLHALGDWKDTQIIL